MENKIWVKFWGNEIISSIAQLCPTLCDPMDCIMTGLPIHNQLPEFTQTHVHWINDTNPTVSSSVITSFCLQSFPASGAYQMSQFFVSGHQSIGVSASASVPPMNIQDWSPLGWTGWISLQSKGLSRVFSNTTVQKHQFFGTQLSLWFNSYIHTWLLERPQLWPDRPLLAKWCLCFLICYLGWSQLFFQDFQGVF